MDQGLLAIPLPQLALAIAPALLALIICYRWSTNVKRAGWSVLRMLVQLLLIGYVLTFIFQSDSAILVVAILLIMIAASTWIAIGSLAGGGLAWFAYALVSICVGGVSVLLLVTQAVLQLEPWYNPQFMIPLAGMIFANSMNTVSLAGERLLAELAHRVSYEHARSTAFNAALIPNINSMFAVGLVSLPGMMTGQILSGVSPLIAVRYQIMVMCMIFGCAAISAACFLSLVRQRADHGQMTDSDADADVDAG